MDAKGLLNALLAYYSERSEYTRVSAADLLIHAAELALDVPEEHAESWVAEDLAERRAARA